MKNYLSSLSQSLTFALALLSVLPALAQTNIPDEKEPFQFGAIEQFDSKALQEPRILNIYLPNGYHPDSVTTYPVVYVLDGSAHEDFPHIAGLVQFMNMYEVMPQSIVVGIANVDRYRDFTHPSEDPEDLESLPQSGGSEKFMDFLQKEVQPLVDKEYLTNGHNTIVGQSLGGLLATEILMKRPDMFDDYIIVSPSLWWDRQSLIDTAPAYFKEHQELKKKVFVSMGTEHPVMHEVADELVKAMADSGNKNMRYTFSPLPDEDHATILHLAAYKGFQWLNLEEQ
jgi:uncharacterized protein